MKLINFLSITSIILALSACGSNGKKDAAPAPQMESADANVRALPSGVSLPKAVMARFPIGADGKPDYSKVETVALDNEVQLVGSDAAAQAFESGKPVSLAKPMTNDDESMESSSESFFWGLLSSIFRPCYNYYGSPYYYGNPYYYNQGGYGYAYYGAGAYGGYGYGQYGYNSYANYGYGYNSYYAGGRGYYGYY